MPLTDTLIRSARPKEKPYKLSDGKSLYILVKTTGKYFRFDYRFAGKRKTLALGVYPQVSLVEARKMHAEARRYLDSELDPGQFRARIKQHQTGQTANSLETLAREWHSNNLHNWTRTHATTIMRRLERNIFIRHGAQAIESITAPELLTTLRRIESRGTIETAHRVKQICSQIFRYAVATGRAERDPCADLRGSLSPIESKQMACLKGPVQFGALLRAIDGYQGHALTRLALKLAPLVFVRPGELRHAEWTEIDYKRDQWRIPAEKMKRRSPHIVPLSRQSHAILRKIETISGHDRYVFPSLLTPARPMSGNTILAALRRMGYAKDEMSGHGFRIMAERLLYEQEWPAHIIERQLARGGKRGHEDYAQYLPERFKMMQTWANYLDNLKNMKVDAAISEKKP
jgi:integrase